MSNEVLDCLIVGGGPAGLTAAVYLGRFRRRFLLIDAGRSRAREIPLSHNCAGFPDGITGNELLARMIAHARRYEAEILAANVEKLARTEDGLFLVEVGERAVKARTVLLATGVVDQEPALPDIPRALRCGLLRYCPICDGFEATDRNVAVIGHGANGLGEALFLRTYTPQVTLLTVGQAPKLTPAQCRQIADAGIRVIDEPISRVVIENDRIDAIALQSGAIQRFEALYCALGTAPCSSLAGELHARCDENGCIEVDEHQQTSVPGLYAAGDVVPGIDQIAVAIGHAAIAACAIHRRLPARWRASPVLAR